MPGRWQGFGAGAGAVPGQGVRGGGGGAACLQCSVTALVLSHEWNSIASCQWNSFASLLMRTKFRIRRHFSWCLGMRKAKAEQGGPVCLDPPSARAARSVARRAEPVVAAWRGSRDARPR